MDVDDLTVNSSESNGVEAQSGLQAIARFRNAAEAGFFLDELTRRMDITAEIAPQEQFDAVHASWSTDFVLLVPAKSALTAAQCLQELVEQTAAEQKDDESSSGPHTAPLVSGRVWLPLAITLAVGAMSCWAFERLERPQQARGQPSPRRPPAPRFLETLSASPGAWVQPIPGTRGCRRATFDRTKRSTLWEEDRDGDGQFEIRHEEAWLD